MIAYNRKKLENGLLLNDAAWLKSAGFISKEQFQEAKKKFEHLNIGENLFLRIVFFVLGSFAYSSISGLLFLIGGLDSNYKPMLFLLALIGLFAAEMLARHDYFNHGLNDAAILGFQMFFIVAVGISFNSLISGFAALAIAGLFSTLRYVNPASALLSLMGICGFVFLLITDEELLSEQFLPIVFFALAVMFYLAHNRLKRYVIYQIPNLVLKTFSLLLGYFSMNYLVVRELSQELLGVVLNPAEEIPMAFLFYFLTFTIPAAYLVFSIRQKDRLMLWLGFGCLCFSIFTIRYYHSVLPIEIAMILGGLLLFGFALICIRKLSDRKHGITFEKDFDSNLEHFSIAASLIAASHATSVPDAQADPMEFGGGDFSGGGAGGNY